MPTSELSMEPTQLTTQPDRDACKESRTAARKPQHPTFTPQPSSLALCVLFSFDPRQFQQVGETS
jgi:hypothetical protein